jgi:hypothetical protein
MTKCLYTFRCSSTTSICPFLQLCRLEPFVIVSQALAPDFAWTFSLEAPRRPATEVVGSSPNEYATNSFVSNKRSFTNSLFPTKDLSQTRTLRLCFHYQLFVLQVWCLQWLCGASSLVPPRYITLLSSVYRDRYDIIFHFGLRLGLGGYPLLTV